MVGAEAFPLFRAKHTRIHPLHRRSLITSSGLKIEAAVVVMLLPPPLAKTALKLLQGVGVGVYLAG
jgi:hypothetical protein